MAEPKTLAPITLEERRALNNWAVDHPELAPHLGFGRTTWKALVVGGPTIAGVPDHGLLKEVTWAYERAAFQRQRAERAEFVLALLLATKEPSPGD